MRRTVAQWFRAQTVESLAPAITNWVALGKLLNLSAPKVLPTINEEVTISQSFLSIKYLPLSSWLSLHGFKAAQQKIPPLPRVSLSLRENTVGDLLQKQNCQTWNYLFVIIRNIVKCPPLSDSGGLDDPDLLRRS